MTTASDTAPDPQPGNDQALKSALNWAYGCGRPDDWGDDVADQLRKQNALWKPLLNI